MLRPYTVPRRGEGTAMPCPYGRAETRFALEKKKQTEEIVEGLGKLGRSGLRPYMSVLAVQ